MTIFIFDRRIFQTKEYYFVLYLKEIRVEKEEIPVILHIGDSYPSVRHYEYKTINIFQNDDNIWYISFKKVIKNFIHDRVVYRAKNGAESSLDSLLRDYVSFGLFSFGIHS